MGVTECATGELVAGHAPGGFVPAAQAARYHAELVRFQQQVLVQGEQQTPGEFSLTITTQWHLVRVVDQGRRLLSLIVDTRSVGLGQARAALNRAAALLA